MLTGTVILAGLALALACLLVSAARLVPSRDGDVAARIERMLPRIQCAQCGYPGCRPYAEAIAAGNAPINRCPPGGEHTVRRLAELLGHDAPPLDKSLGSASLDRVARIDESACIGCNLCSRACPVDAIVGVPQTMHTVLSSHCTGCELCLPPCPVDCIALVARNA
jgi:Na+-translocating ferredoxin:NAD+ oxidoreductase subunit B